MNITAIKGGKYAHPEVSKPQLTLRVGKTYDVDEAMAAALIGTGWGEVTQLEEQVPVSDEHDLCKMTKRELIEYADAHSIELDMKLTNAKMVAVIEASNG